jgi:SAM-dependent methyltransferase
LIATWLKLVGRSIRRGGVRQALRDAPNYVRRQWRLRQFDRRHHTRTSDVRPIDEGEIVGTSAKHASTHLATPQEPFDRMMEALPASPRDLVFVDVGSGLGRVVLYASMLDFKRVIGIEFSRLLHEAALRNVEIFRRNNPGIRPIELVCADALTYELPAEDSLLFFAQPFDREMFERMMRHLARSLSAAPRRLLLLYYDPRHHAAVDESGLFELLVAQGEAGDPRGAWRIWRTLPERERPPR